MKYSWKDLILATISVLHLGIIALVFFVPLTTAQTLVAAFIVVLLTGTNYQCVSHNFLHTPFFKSDFINHCFSVINSLCLGLPQSLYREHHMNHHRFNNDPEKDDSSLYRYGKQGKEENVILYSFIGVFRTDLIGLFVRAKKINPAMVYFELVAVVIFIAALGFLNPGKFLLFYLPTWYLGQVFALLENYAEHHDALLNDRKRDSVSCYNPIYNFVWFNNGYHQEHHYRPTVHWTKVREVKNELPDDRKIVPCFHLTNLN